MKRLLVLLIVNILWVTSITSTTPSQKIIYQLKNKNWKKANLLLKNYIRIKPNKKWAYSSQIRVLKNLKLFHEAIQLSQKALKRWPNNVKIKRSYASALTSLAKTFTGMKSIEIMQQAYNLDNKDYRLYQLAKQYRKLGKLEKALRLYKQGSKRFPNYKYFSQALPYTRYLIFKKINNAKKIGQIKKHLLQTLVWLNNKKSIAHQYYYFLMIRFGLRTINSTIFFEKVYQKLFKLFPHQPRIYDDYGFQLYANFRLHNKATPALKKKAIRFRRKAFNYFWAKYKKPNTIKYLGHPLKGRTNVWSSFGGRAMTHNGYANYCYDFATVDASNHIYNKSKSGKKNLHYYMFNQPIYAVADGIVSGIINGFPDNKPGGFSASANTITINHGKYSSFYAHLKYNGIIVREKQKVKRGQLIGYAGNSGMSSQSHLHFCMYQKIGERISVPFEFAKAKVESKKGQTFYTNKPYIEGNVVNFKVK